MALRGYSLKTIIFGFSRPIKKHLFAEAIMKIDDNNFDHGYTRFRSDRWDADFIYQASGLRTNFMGGKYFASINTVVEEYELEVEDETEAMIGHLCVDREGLSYPIKMVIGIGVVKLAALVGKKINNPWPSDKPDCIAEQGYILSRGLKVNVPFDFNSATPKPFRDWLKTLPNIKRVK